MPSSDIGEITIRMDDEFKRRIDEMLERMRAQFEADLFRSFAVRDKRPARTPKAKPALPPADGPRAIRLRD